MPSKVVGHRGAEDIRAAGMAWVGEEKLWGFWGQKEDQKGLEKGEEAAQWSWGQQGHWGYWGLTGGAQKHLGSKSWKTVQRAMGHLEGSQGSPPSPPSLC